MHALVLFYDNQHTKFEVFFANYKDVIRAKFKKTGHMTLTTPLLRVVYYHRRLGFDTVYLHAQFDDSDEPTSPVFGSLVGVTLLKFRRDL